MAIPLPSAIHAVAVLMAAVTRRVTWRRVTCEVQGPFDVRVLDYQPHRQPEPDGRRRTSV